MGVHLALKFYAQREATTARDLAMEERDKATGNVRYNNSPANVCRNVEIFMYNTYLHCQGYPRGS
jgi:hypothetical protein